MDATTLKVVGEVAGAGGVIPFLVIFFFREMITSKLAERLSRPQAARTVQIMIAAVAIGDGVTAMMSRSTSTCASTTNNITISQDAANTTALGTGCGNTTIPR
jgi:hypothetical protein